MINVVGGINLRQVMNTLGEFVVKGKLNEIRNMKPQSRYDWDNLNFPPLLHLYHVNISELPDRHRFFNR
jgi:hypothetical protein